MSWIIYGLIAIWMIALSDLCRKLVSNLKDPVFANFVFQVGAFSTALLVFLFTGGVIEKKPKVIAFGLIGGCLIALFSLFTIKALKIGPSLSVVMPSIRIGGVALVALLGILILKEKLSFQVLLGLIFSAIGVYLLFTIKK